MDRVHYEQLRHAMDGPTERDRFRTAFEPGVGQSTDPEQFAALKMQPSGQCVFLDDDRLCSIQRQYGESYLGNMCAVYPRDIASVGDRLEVTASLSCPEVARLCLLADDAMEYESFDPRLLSRHHAFRRFNPNPDDPYFRHLDLIRGTMLELLSLEPYSLATRLFFVAYFAHRVTPFFSRETNAFDEHRLTEEIQRLRVQATLDELHRQFTGITIPSALALRIIQVVVLARLQVHIPSFHQLVSDGLASYQQLPSPLPNGPVSIALDELWEQYQERRRYWTTLLGKRLDQMFANYCKNYWLKDWYVLSRSLLAHTQGLLLRLAILRFLLFSHPQLQAAADASVLPSQPATKAQERILERTTVEVFYKVCRALEHDPSFLDKAQGALEAEGIQSLAHLMFLLRI
jgi:lysine-N-methylase